MKATSLNGRTVTDVRISGGGYVIITFSNKVTLQVRGDAIFDGKGEKVELK